MTGNQGALAYFSSTSDNTHRLVRELGIPASRLPLRRTDPALIMTSPFVLVTPTYGSGDELGAVPKQVIRFLNVEQNRHQMRGVVATGNTNFGSGYCRAGDIIAAKCGVPVLARIEIFGTPEDRDELRATLARFWAPRT